MEVGPQRDVAGDRADGGHPPRDVGRHGDADRVGDRELGDARRGESRGQLDDSLHGDLALERAAEGRRRARRTAGMPAAVASGTTSSTVRTACSVVMPWFAWLKRVRGHDDQVDLVDRRLRGPGEAATVEHEADRATAARRYPGRRRHREDRLGVGHLGHALRIDEGRGLDPGEAGIRAATYELDLVRRRQLGGVVLEAVPRGDLDDLGVAHDATVRLSRSDR